MEKEILLTTRNKEMIGEFSFVIEYIEKICNQLINSPIGEHIDVPSFQKNFYNLKFKKSEEENGLPMKMDEKNNVLYINLATAPESDLKFWVTREMLTKMVKCDKPEREFKTNEVMKLYDGTIRSNIAESLVGNDDENKKITDEAVVFELLLKTSKNSDEVFEAYFKDDVHAFVKAADLDAPTLKVMAHNSQFRHKIGRSLLPELQNQIMENFLSSRELTKEERKKAYSEIPNSCVTSAEVMGEDYPGMYDNLINSGVAPKISSKIAYERVR